MFDQKIYDEIVNTTFPIEPVDATHTWTTTTRRSIVVNVNGKLGEMEKLQVLTADPSNSSSTPQIMAEEKNPVEGRSYTMLYIAPVAQKTFYAAIRTIDGKYAVVPFEATAQQINFTDKSIVNAADVTKWQEFTYIFEENFPEPGDYDFNDCVMRISMQPGNKKNQVKVNVTLAAVGAKATIAGAIKLLNYTADDIESIEVEGGSAFDDGYPIPLKAFSSGDTFLTGQNGSDAVIRLFECAQYALARNTDEWGDIAVIRYNTSHEVAENYSAIVDPVTRTYRITFNSRDVARLFTFDHIDPFIIHEYNTGYWEVHTFPHRFEMLISNMETNLRAYDYPVSWSLVIPKSDFRYCRQGISLSSYNSTTGEVFGPYTDFTTWMQNHNNAQARKWYETLNVPSLVY
jgi:LruC domain-containing protein